jgi:hypothetical protein
MASAQSTLVIRKMPWSANFTEMNHLGAALIAKPHVFGDVMTRLFSSYNYSENPITALLSGTGREVTINTNEWTWSLRGASVRPLVFVGTAAVGTPGKGNSTFSLDLDENWFKPGDIIHPGSPKDQVRIKLAPTRVGNHWRYIVEPNTKDVNYFVPLRFLKPGVKWSKLFSQYGEGSSESGSTMYALPLELQSRLSRYRKEYSITADAALEVLAVKVPDSTGKMHTFWMKYAEAEFWMQWAREIDRGYMYSRSTDKVEDSSGRPTYSGPGIDEYLEDSNRHVYNTLTTKLIEEFIMDIQYSRIAPGPGRELKALTGEYGMIAFHRAVTENFQKSGFITVDSNFIEKSKSPYHTNGLSYGAQFTKYKMANGATLELIHNPIQDDRTIHYEIDPLTNYPYESQKFYFLDFAGEGSESNIVRVKKNNGQRLAYVSGLYSPFGNGRNQNAAHTGDYYTMTVHDQCGVWIKDVTRCGVLEKARV